MIKVLIFDLGNVLFFFDQEKSIKEVAKVCRVPEEQIRSILIENGLIYKYEKGEIETTDFLTIFQKKLNKSIDFEKLVMAASDIFTPNDELDLILIKAKRLGLKLVLLSNTNELHYSFLEANFSILKVFDAKVLSYQLKMSKPDKAIFEAAIKVAGTFPEECFLTDDTAENIEAAKQCGIDAVQFKNNLSLKQELSARGIKF